MVNNVADRGTDSGKQKESFSSSGIRDGSVVEVCAVPFLLNLDSPHSLCPEHLCT